MAVLAAILPIVSRSSALSLDLYRFAASEPDATKELVKTAKSISNLALIIKQVGTIIKEDDRLPSAEAIETLEDTLDQCTAILSEIEAIVSHHRNANNGDGDKPQRNGDIRLNSAVVARLNYLAAHLDSLRLTSSVMLQTLYTSQSIMWARVRPTVSPNQCATAVANEKYQLETLIIEQQMSILLASKLYEPSRPDARLLMEYDSSQCLVAVDRGQPKPADLFKYQDKFIATLDTHESDEVHWLPAICGSSRSQVDRLLDRWSRLRQFEEGLQEANRKAQAQKRETQQPFVESDSEDDVGALPKFVGSGIRLATPTPRRPDKAQSLFTETATLPIPVRDPKFGPTTPLSPASSFGASPRSSGSNLPIPNSPASSPVSPRTSITALPPVEAAAAVEAKHKDDDIDLEIPWTLCTRRHWWKYIDGKIEDSNTDAPSSEAFSDRNAWTEVLASWVCKEAIKEAGFQYTRVQKERRDGRRTKFETCFCIDQPLTFDQVHRLVERTVDIYRKTQPPSPPPQKEPRRSSFERHQAHNGSSAHDRDRTPLANNNHRPPLERSIASYPPPAPPPLDRSLSMPGGVPTYPPNPRATNLTLPLTAGAGSPLGTQYIGQAAPQFPQSQEAAHYTSQPEPQAHANAYVPQQAQQPSFPPPPQTAPFSQHLYTSPQALYPPTNPPFAPLDPRFFQPRQPYSEPTHSSHSHRDRDRYSSTESDSPSRSHKHRSKSRRRSESRHSRKAHEHSGATKALMGVAGLTALLDGLVGI